MKDYDKWFITNTQVNQMGNWIGKSIEELNLVSSVLSKSFSLGTGLHIYKRKIHCSTGIDHLPGLFNCRF